MNRIVLSQKTLKYTYGVVVLLTGLDKLFQTNLIVDWGSYMSPFFTDLLPISVGSFLLVVAVVEIAVGILLLTKWTRTFAYVAAGWLVLISINLLILGAVDIAVRDIVLAVGALVLAWLTEDIESRRA